MRAQLSFLSRMALVFCACTAFSTARADIYVIANPGAPLQQITQQQVADLYLGRTRSLDGGNYVTLLDQSNNEPVRERFFRLIANMSQSQVNAYWARLTFTGRQQPPQSRSNDAKVIETVSRDPQAIGYVSTLPPSGQVRVLLHLHE